MFSFFRMKGLKRVLPVCLALGLLVLAGCPGGGGDNDINIPGALPTGLVGKWEEPTYNDFFQITGSPETLAYDANYGGLGDYVGNIEFVSNYNSSAGVIIIKYTSGAPDGTKLYHAIYYLDFKPGISVSLNNTWDATDPLYNADTATLQEAIEKFTKGKMGNWMDPSSAPTYNKTS